VTPPKVVTPPHATKKVVITGLGLVTPIGIGTEAVWQRLHDPRSAVQTVTRFDPTPFRSHVAAAIDDFDPVAQLSARTARRTDRCSQLALAATDLAIADAGMQLSHETPSRVGVMMGTALGGIGFAEEENSKYVQGGLRAVDPLLALTVFAGAVSCNIAIAHQVTGVNATNAMSCASGTLAIGQGFRAIASGEADVVLAGGSEAPLYPLCFGSFAMIRAMSTRNDDPGTASRPFDQGRDGFVMAEGAAVLVLESLEHAQQRGAKIYAEVAGFGLTNDAHHMTRPLPDGQEAMRAMQLALREADVTPTAVDWVNAHGSSTPLNDAVEAAAIREVFGAHADQLMVSGTKGWHGHALGASGAIEVAIACLAMTRGWTPGSLNCIDPVAEGQLPFVPQGGVPRTPQIVLKNSFGFGGTNATLLLRQSTI
jgi:3-oxoacyl-[acyl-carrier-protein] synthase II